MALQFLLGLQGLEFPELDVALESADLVREGVQLLKKGIDYFSCRIARLGTALFFLGSLPPLSVWSLIVKILRHL